MDDWAAGSVDQERGRLHGAQLVGANEMVSFRSQQRVDSQEIRFPKQRGLIDISGPELCLNCLIDALEVIIESPHPEAQCPPGHGLADPAEPEDPQGLAV